MTEPTQRPARWSAGCLVAVLLAAATPIAGGGYLWYRWDQAAQRAQEAQAQRAQEVFAPALEMLEPPPEPDVDIDATIRVIHEIDQALQQQDSLDAWLRHAATRDHRGVAPDVLASRRELFGILQDLYARQTQAEAQQAVWELTGELLLSTLSVVSVSGEAGFTGPSGSLNVDRQQARSLLQDLRERQRERTRLLRDIDQLEKDLFQALLQYAEVYWNYVDEWEQLSLLRDRAWLAVHAGDWGAARASADLAVARAPHDREAHLIAAMARIEGGTAEDHAEAAALLEKYLDRHPDHSAPALLLLGALHEARGEAHEARLALQQAAAYYPRQADALDDALDPYAIRSYLQRSREGGLILEQYRSMMLGAGYFSPDLQLARLLFTQNQDEAARAKVLDHFARRRAQKQWDFILSDLQFCHDLLGPHYWEIFPEDAWLDLQVNPTLLGKGLTLSVRNRSARTLHNATLVLALHLTDMMPGDYVALAAGPTVPAVLAHNTTDFGSITLDLEVDGARKTLDDVVFHRAILVSNEAVVWVDTDAYRIAESQAFREKRRTDAETPVTSPANRFPSFSQEAQRLLTQARQESKLRVESRYGPDDVVVELPRELAILRPLFRLRRGETLFTAKDNLIEGDRIVLRFASVANFDGVEDPGALELVLSSPFGEVVLSWVPGGDLTWRLAP